MSYKHNTICATHDHVRKNIEKVMELLMESDSITIIPKIQELCDEAVALVKEAKSQGQDMEEGLYRRKEAAKVIEKELLKLKKETDIVEDGESMADLAKAMSDYAKALSQAVQSQKFLLKHKTKKELTGYLIGTINRPGHSTADYRNNKLFGIDISKKTFKIAGYDTITFKNQGEFDEFLAQVKIRFKSLSYISKMNFEVIDWGYCFHPWTQREAFFGRKGSEYIDRAINSRAEKKLWHDSWLLKREDIAFNIRNDYDEKHKKEDK